MRKRHLTAAAVFAALLLVFLVFYFISPSDPMGSPSGASTASADTNADWVLYFVLLFLIVGQAFLGFLLWKVREVQNIRLRSADGGNLVMFPESFEHRITTHVKEGFSAYEALKRGVHQIDGRVASNLNAVEQGLSNVRELLKVFHDEVERKNADIERFRAGFDASVVDTFSERVAKVRTLMLSEIEESKDEALTRILQDVLELVDDALEGVGIEEFKPEIGAEFKTAYGLDQNFKRVRTADQELHGTIESVVTPGLKVKSTLPGVREPIRRCVVSVYSYDKTLEEGEEEGETS